MLFSTSLILTPGPGELQPEVFEKGIISTDAIETNSAFTPDGKTVYFTRRAGKWGDFKNKAKGVIYLSNFEKGKWQTPRIASFSGDFSDSDVGISPDGGTLFFTSDRPLMKGGEVKKDKDIWMCKKTSGGWGDPIHLGNTVNSAGTEYSPVTANNGNLYFASTRPGGLGQGDLYMCRFVKGKYQEPVNLGERINSKTGEWNLYVSPDESYIIFEASGRKENKSVPGDLYLSFRRNHQWSKPANLEELNTTGSDLMPKVSPDRKYLYFSGSGNLQSTDTDIYRIDLSVIISKYIGEKE
ncbi:MAG: hypothetical protein GY940_18930, partial [bacterium]|nr:hypothetical protein [bacterium]